MITEVEETDNTEIEYLNNYFTTFNEMDLNENIKHNPFLHILVYKKDAKIVGVLLYSLIYERIELEQLEVLENYRRQMIASSLMEYLIAIAKGEKVTNITLEVKDNNVNAIALYQKYGFQLRALRKNYYQNEDGLLMEKVIE